MALNQVFLEKITLNIGVGEGGTALEMARKLLELVSGRKPASTTARSRQPEFKIRQGDVIGAKVTLRGKGASEVLEKALKSVEQHISEKSFDDYGNVAFGIKEYIDFPGLKYDPKIGMMGFDVCISLRKKGHRVANRRIASRKLPRKQRVSKPEARAFLEKNYGVKFQAE
ncbi:MAG TPA: 50S ribosomal protein L5 [Candidatus Norongarragalinales archaeon]|nr:50S ribosomal protein L5P [uncultured archaeon]HLC38444.1 50S ribosomal protein L5 [Candidatus Norongarragalinales archaeon]